MTNFYENKEGELFVDPIVANHTDLTKLSNAEGERRHAKAIKNAPPPLTSVQVRNKALADIDVYDFEDGRVIQIRLTDRDNLKGGIQKGTNVWKMLDNKVYSVTTAELQTALNSQESKISQIWMTHFADLEVGKVKKG